MGRQAIKLSGGGGEKNYWAPRSQKKRLYDLQGNIVPGRSDRRPPQPSRSPILSPESRPERGWVGLQLSCHPPSASRFSPAFLSFLFLYTERITSKLPSRSTAMVKIRITAKVEATQGGLSKVSWSCGPEPFSPLPLTDMPRRRGAAHRTSRTAMQTWTTELRPFALPYGRR